MNDMRLEFTVYAGAIEQGPRKGEPCEPEPQGSARAFLLPGHKHPIVTTDNPDLKRWRKSVQKAAEAALFEFPGVYTAQEAPVRVYLLFFMLRPKARKKDEYHIVRPDLDKLCRGVLDGLKDGGIYKNDSQVCNLSAWKLYGSPARCEVSVRPIEGDNLRELAPAGEHPISLAGTGNTPRLVPAGDSGLLAATGKLWEE